MNPVRVDDDRTVQAINELIRLVGGDPQSFDGGLITQLVQTSLKLIPDGHDTGQLKLLNSALKEMRYAYRIFNRYRGTHKISIFGSARTPEDHPDYIAAKKFSAAMADNGWMSITGAGDGIMKAGHEGPTRESSFGLSIRLPFETSANTVIEGDPKLINFRYFFTRKLMFISHADAVAVFPGGFGTQDELFEALTLVQTGKSNVVPIVLIEGTDGEYWKYWYRYVEKNLLDNGWVSPGDPSIFYLARDERDAVEHVMRFYSMFHSCRYVRDTYVIRIKHPLSDVQVEQLNEEFSSIVKSGKIEQVEPFPEESDHLDLPRIAFEHTRRDYSHLRKLIDRINDFAASDHEVVAKCEVGRSKVGE